MAGVAGTWLGSIPTFPRRAAPWYLIPMDDVQTDHLKAYGVTYRVLERGRRAEWFLNYRGGSFLLPARGCTDRDAALRGVTLEPLDDDGCSRSGPRSRRRTWSVPLEKPPKVAVYTRPTRHPGTTR